MNPVGVPIITSLVLYHHYNMCFYVRGPLSSRENLPALKTLNARRLRDLFTESMADSVITLEIPPPSIKQSPKKNRNTRDQPNLSDCHCCSRRFNSTNPKERLRPLSSEWRIVLLCKHCYKLVESARLCSYCFSGISTNATSLVNGDSNSYSLCPRCNRAIHSDCMSEYSNLPPWSFLPRADVGGGGGGVDPLRFPFCIDCWLPKLLDNRSRGDRSGSKRGLMVSPESSSLGNSRISDPRERTKLLKVAANEADRVAINKIAAVVEAKDKALLKSKAAQRAVELAAEALDLVAKRRDKFREIRDSGTSVTDDDAQLASQLHRAMNSSPRITRNLLLPNSGVGGCANAVLSRDASSCLRSRLGRSSSDVAINSDSLDSEAVAQTSSSSKSMNPGSDDHDSTDADSASSVELGRHCSGETEQKCIQKCGESSDMVKVDRYLIKYSRRASQSTSCGFGLNIESHDIICEAPAGAAYLKCSDQSGAGAYAS